MVEIRVEFTADEQAGFSEQTDKLRELLLEAGLIDKARSFPSEPAEDTWQRRYAALLAETAVLLQRHCGHRVEFHAVLPGSDPNRVIALAEHEDSHVGMHAVVLAASLVEGQVDDFSTTFQAFRRFAAERILPLETEALTRAATSAGIPYLQLDREPLLGRLNTGKPIRPNALVCLGHGRAREILDGSFCITRASSRERDLLASHARRRELLSRLGLINEGHSRSPGTMPYCALAIGDRVIAAHEADGDRAIAVHDSIADQVLHLAAELGGAPVSVTFETTDPSRPLAANPVSFVDFDLAPDLEGLPATGPDGEPLLGVAAQCLVQWLFPDASIARIPIVAVTGTNGKTTASRMISHVFMAAGMHPGLVCTDGIFIDGRQLQDVDAGTILGHARVLTEPKIDAAVLESHHRGIAIRGFAYQRSNVAVCLNVTEEHLAPGEIETIEEMTRIKRALLEHAADAAVLFADDPNCRTMIPHLDANSVCLVSMQSSAEELKQDCGQQLDCCVIEAVDSVPWMVIHHDKERTPIIPVSNIPATFEGTLPFNVSNAMHAAAAAFFAGIDPATISAALETFVAGQALTPGRMNVFDELPFRIIMDFAHNPDAMKQISEFMDHQQPAGRKIIAFSGLSKRDDTLNRKSAQAVAGHFDFYFCKDIEPENPPKRRFTGPFMQQVLIEEGVPESATRVLTFGRDAFFEIFDTCQAGDLLLVLAGRYEARQVPGYIRAYRQALATRSAPA